MKDIVIIGAGGFGREVQWLIERINQKNKIWNLIGFIDDGLDCGTNINGIPVIGNVDCLINYNKHISAACTIGSSKTRKKVIEQLKVNKNIYFPNLIDPSVIMSNSIKFGSGVIICAGTILTVNIELGDFIIINLDCTIGHDVRLNSYVTLYPSVNVSGNVSIGEITEIGTGTQIIQGKNILNETIVGAGAIVTKDIPAMCTAIGSPAKPIKFL